ALTLWRVTLEDAAGRELATTLVAIVIDTAAIGHVDSLRERVEIECAGWRQQAESVLRGFNMARLTREQLKADHPSLEPNRSPIHPGLFDRRSERSQVAQSTADRLSRDDHRAIRQAIEESLTFRPPFPQLALVLLPR